MKRIIFGIVLVLFLTFYFWSNSNEFANDYYEFVNKDFLKDDYLKDDKYVYNTFTEAQEVSNEVRDGIINDVVNGKSFIDGNVSNKVNILYNNVIDINERNNISINPLKKYIEMIMGSNNIKELINNSMIVENELGVDIFTRIVIDRDFMDNSKNIVYLYPVTFAFGSSSDYYVDDNYMTYKAYIKRAIIRILVEYGYSKNEARFISNEIISFYKEIGGSSKLSNSYEDITSYYNIVDDNYLKEVYNKFDFKNYLDEKGINEEEYSLVDEGQYRKINEYLTDEYLIIWKKVILVEILSSYASYVDSGYYNIVNSLNNSLTGVEEEINYEEDAIDLVGSVFSSDIDRLYEKIVIKDEEKESLRDLFNDIKFYFGKMLKENSWLSNDTKEKALIKLDNMKVYVGIEDDDSYGNIIDVSGENFISNIISINKSSFNLSLKLLDDDKTIKALSESEVNAYYSPVDNAVYIPSSVMFLMDREDSYYEILGTIGMVIAHEVTHGFDYNGSLFDKDGNLNNWWNDIDRDNYAKLKKQVSDYYSKIEVLNGKYINGEKTVNENIADMGAVKVISEIAKDKGASKEEMREMYSSFASFWKCQVNDDYAKLLLLNDSHSPNKYRVNAVLSVTSDFFDVYNVYPWNDMYIFDNNRVSVWQ